MTKLLKEIEVLKEVKLTSVSLEIKENTPIEKWLEIGKVLDKISGAVQWWWGDWLIQGEQKYGEMYSQALSASPYKLETLRFLKSVCSKVEMLVRTNNLSFRHHSIIAPLEKKEQIKWLKEAEENNWTTQELRDAIKRGNCNCEFCEFEEVIIWQCKKCGKIEKEL